MSSLAGAVGSAVWAELVVTDIERATAFYGPLLGWRFQEAADGHDRSVSAWVDRRPVASLVCPEQSGYDVLWTVYFETSDVAGVVEAASGAGATILVPPVGVTGFGRLAERPAFDSAPNLMPWYFPASDLGELATMAVLADPTGTDIGLWRWRGRTGADAVSGAVAAAWHISEHPADAAAALCGLPGCDQIRDAGAEFFRSPDVLAAIGPLWLPVFGVPDLEAAVRHAIDLGGHVVRPPIADLRGALLGGPKGEPFGVVRV
jgi:predicted enzyme related to lactoylglutathione lyase